MNFLSSAPSSPARITVELEPSTPSERSVERALAAAVGMLGSAAPDGDEVVAIQQRFEASGLRWSWQLNELDALDWDGLGVSLGLKTSLKAAAKRCKTSVPDEAGTSSAQPAPATPRGGGALARARKRYWWGVGAIGWRNAHISWLQALVTSGQPGPSIRSALHSWLDGYTIQWLLFFATVAPVSFAIGSDELPLRRAPSTAPEVLAFVYVLVVSALVGTLLCGLWVAAYTSQLVSSVSDANIAAALAGPVLPFVRRLLHIYTASSALSIGWLHLTLHLSFVGDGCPWWAAALLHLMCLAFTFGTFGTLGAGGLLRGRMDGSVYTSILAFGGLLREEAALPPAALEGKSHAELLEALAAKALAEEPGRPSRARPWRFESGSSGQLG